MAYPGDPCLPSTSRVPFICGDGCAFGNQQVEDRLDFAHEAEVGPLADGLKAALANVIACYKGRFVGQDNDVKVFDVQHIKGLEFEAVFFVGIDALAELRPELFDKYLYVGATRAATYLGLTCVENELPKKIRVLRDDFIDHWSA